MTLRVTREVLERMRVEAAASATEECCGLLLGDIVVDEARPTANVALDRSRRFEVDPQALIDAHRAARAGGPAVLGYYHSHPAGSTVPSATDQAMRSGDGRVWAILGAGDVTFWRDDRDGFAPLPYAVEDR